MSAAGESLGRARVELGGQDPIQHPRRAASLEAAAHVRRRERPQHARDQTSAFIADAEDPPSVLDTIRTTVRMTVFIRGTSPPLVRTAIRLVVALLATS